ncbi:MAG: hypothetical protein AAFY38_09240 [Pseudomonadota bacterium]
MWRAALILCLYASAAEAGAWLREPGAGFFALSGTVNDRMENATSLYVEYGLREALTLGADLDVKTQGGAYTSGGGRVFARLPLGDGTWKSSWMLGLGARVDSSHINPFASLGYSVGRGLDWRGGGWANLDLRLDLGRGDTSQVKLDGTVGLKIGDKGKAMMQLFLTLKDDSGLEATLAPSYVFAPGKHGASWHIGVEAKKAELAIKLGLWRDF